MSIEYNPNDILGISGSSSVSISSEGAPYDLSNICFAFQNGDCKRGSSCRFKHEKPTSNVNKNIPEGLVIFSEGSSFL